MHYMFAMFPHLFDHVNLTQRLRTVVLRRPGGARLWLSWYRSGPPDGAAMTGGSHGVSSNTRGFMGDLLDLWYFSKKTSINTTITYVGRFMGCDGNSMGFLTGILATPRKMLNSKLENITKPCYHLETTSKGFSPPCARHVSADQIKNKQTYIYILFG